MKIISSGPYACGETPHWDNRRESLFWVDAASHLIYSWKGGLLRSYDTGLPVSAIRKKDTNTFYLLTKWGLYSWKPEADDRDGIILEGADCLDNTMPLRFNDGLPLTDGSFAAGAFDESDLYNGQGKLYIIDENKKCTLIDSGLHVPNGVACSHDGKTLYLSEMYKYRILAYDLSSHMTKRIAFEIPEDKGMPDGLLCDEEGNIWVAHWKGAALSCYNPKGELLRTVSTDCTTPTCPCFGKDEQEMYYTSATLELSDETIQSYSAQGGVFKIDLN